MTDCHVADVLPKSTSKFLSNPALRERQQFDTRVLQQQSRDSFGLCAELRQKQHTQTHTQSWAAARPSLQWHHLVTYGSSTAHTACLTTTWGHQLGQFKLLVVPLYQLCAPASLLSPTVSMLMYDYFDRLIVSTAVDLLPSSYPAIVHSLPAEQNDILNDTAYLQNASRNRCQEDLNSCPT